uniref:Fe2OG dioxygenase domain-containing protein n=1 Tax=Prasinoderma singulare TaxID=676789 RepID=A0A7S3BU81_9VIRI
MVAAYPPGAAGYSEHIDNVDGDGDEVGDGRLLTAVLYLTAGWDSTRHGGQLRVKTHARPGEGGGESSLGSALLVAPAAGTVVLFKADSVRHAVLPTAPMAPRRFALTLWLMGAWQRDLGDAADRAGASVDEEGRDSADGTGMAALAAVVGGIEAGEPEAEDALPAGDADELAAALIALGDLFGDTTSGAEEGGVSGNEDEASDVSAGAPAPPTPSMYPN